MKMLDYLYYKIYKAHLKGSLNDIAEWAAAMSIGGLLGVNILVITSFLRKVNLLPFFFTGKRQVVILMVCSIVGTVFLFLYKKKYRQIIAKYEQESENERKKGNLVVWLYVIISFLLIFAVAFYRPGKI